MPNVCDDILEATNLFQCFGLPLEQVEPSKIRALYLQIAIKVHPDKNTSPKSTAAFQKLSDAFETLHNEDKQETYLQSCRVDHKRKRQKKNKDFADLVVPARNWYKMDWESVESEIQRMTNEFKEHLLKAQEKKEKVKEKRLEKKLKKEKKIKQNLNYLYEKYGIDLDSDSDSNTVCSKPESSVHTDIEVKETSKSQTSFICTICRRQFLTESHLANHYSKSELHRNNLEKLNTVQNRFKNTFHGVDKR